MLTGEKFLLCLMMGNNGKLALGGAGLGLKNWLPGTVLKDLKLRGKIDLFNSGKRKNPIHIQVIDNTPTGHPILDEYLYVLANYQGKKGATTQAVKKWVIYFRDKYKKKKYTENLMWASLEKQGVLVKRGKKHPLLKPEIRDQLYADIRLVLMNKKVPDEEFRALLFLTAWGHGRRHYLKRSQRDTKYCKEVIQGQIILSIIWWEIIVEKRKAIGGGVTAASGTISAAGAGVLAASDAGVNTLVHGMSHTNASQNLNTSMTNINLKRSHDLQRAQHSSVKVQMQKKKLFCSSCGQEQDSITHKFCKTCGKPLS